MGLAGCSCCLLIGWRLLGRWLCLGWWCGTVAACLVEAVGGQGRSASAPESAVADSWARSSALSKRSASAQQVLSKRSASALPAYAIWLTAHRTRRTQALELERGPSPPDLCDC